MLRLQRTLVLLLAAPALLTACQKARNLAPAPVPVALTRDARYEGQPDISPDGLTLLFCARGAVDLDLYTMPVAGGGATLLYSGPGDDDQPRWSPDGSKIVFRGAPDGAPDLFLIPSTGGEAKRLTVESGRDESPDWSPDGGRIVFVSDRGGRPELWLLTLLSGSAEPLTSGDPPASNYRAGSPDWAGERIYFSADVNGIVDLYSIGSGGGAWKKITNDPAGQYAPAVSVDGRIAYVDDETGFRNLYILETDGRITPVIEERTDILEAAWTPDGKTLIYAQRSGIPLLSMPVGGGAADTVLDARGANLHPTFSPDGTEVAYDALLERQYDIWRVAVSEPGAGPVTSNNGDDREPDWSPAVNRIAFSSVRDGIQDIWFMDPSGVEYTNVTGNPARDRSPGWSPDGSRLVFVSDRDGHDMIWWIAATGGEALRLTDGTGTDADPSWFTAADGTDWVVFASTREGTRAVWKMPVAGGKPERLTTPAAPGDWDGRPVAAPGPAGMVAFVRHHGGDQGIYLLDPGSGEPRKFADDPSSMEDNPAFSPDGKRIIYQGGGNHDLWSIAAPSSAPPEKP